MLLYCLPDRAWPADVLSGEEGEEIPGSGEGRHRVQVVVVSDRPNRDGRPRRTPLHYSAALGVNSIDTF